VTVIAALAIAVAVLTIHNLGVERVPSALYVPACLGTAGILLGLAGWAGIGVGEVGVSAAGLDTGVGAGVAVAVLIGVAALLPITRPLFADRRMAGVGWSGTAYRALVRSPLGTVVVEEVAFRGVLPALLDRLVPLAGAVVVSCVLFGLWHVVPMRATLATNRLPVRPVTIAAAVAASSIAGAGLCWLRLSAGGLVAPAIVHAFAIAVPTVVASFVLRPARLEA